MAERVFRTLYAEKWNGSNGAVIAATVALINVDNAVWSVSSETADALVLHQYQPSTGVEGMWRVVPSNPWVIVAPDQGIVGRLTDTQYAARLTTAAGMRASLGVGYDGMGVSALRSLSIGNSSFNVDIPIDPEQPGTAGRIKVWPINATAAILSALTMGTPVMTSTTNVRVPVTITGLLAVGTVAFLARITPPAP